MSNSLFGNPKIALAFAGGVVAVALVASVALDQFTTGAEQPAEPADAAVAVPAPAPTTPASAGSAWDTGSGWGDAGSADAGWGSTSQAPSGSAKPEIAGPQAEDPFADFGASNKSPAINAGGRGGSGGPVVTSSVAPGAPPIEPPRGKARGSLTIAGD